jgi:hypothetical protein
MISLSDVVILLSLRYMMLAGAIVVDSGKTAMTKARMLASLAVGGLFFGAGLFIMGFIGKTTSVDHETGLRSAVGAQEPRQTTVVEGVTLAYTDSGGHGLTIICLHAIGHGARDFEDLTRRMASDYRVVAIDFQVRAIQERFPASKRDSLRTSPGGLHG